MTDLDRYTIARWAYSVGKPIMEDAEYNALDRSIKAQFPTLSICQRSWSSDPCPMRLLKKYNMKDLIMSVVLSDKTESIPSLNNLLAVRMAFQYMNKLHSVSFKLDGWNLQASYYDGELIHVQTRGRSADAMDAGQLREMLPQTIPEKGKVLVIMELLVPNEDYGFFITTFGAKSQRGAVSTALAHPALCLEHIKVIAHGIRAERPIEDKFATLESWGFKTPMHIEVSSYTELMSAIKALSDYKEQYPYPTDGVVVAGEELVRAVRIMAWEEPIYQSYVLGCREAYGPHSISIQVDIYPIRLSNSTQTTLPATNLKRVIEHNLQPGFPIAFRVASSAIADIDETATDLLQREWKGKEASFRWMVENNEALKLS